jgi:hypothetical protein
MTNTQLYFAIGLPCFTIVTSLIISLVQISSIREDVRELRKEVGADIREVRSDIKLLTGKVYELMEDKH